MAQDIPDEFTVSVDGVGQFRFHRRTMGRQLRIACAYDRLTEGMGERTPEFVARVATCLADLEVLTVSGPKDWDPERADGFDPDAFVAILKVWEELRRTEMTFRAGPVGAEAPRA